MLSSLEKNATTLPLEVRHYGTIENTYGLYDDDGVSYDYSKGAFSITQLKAKKDVDGKFIGTSTVSKNDEFTYGPISWRWMTTEK
jgi:alpha-D-xyloside xylohydrolase